MRRGRISLSWSFRTLMAMILWVSSWVHPSELSVTELYGFVTQKQDWQVLELFFFHVSWSCWRVCTRKTSMAPAFSCSFGLIGVDSLSGIEWRICSQSESDVVMYWNTALNRTAVSSSTVRNSICSVVTFVTFEHVVIDSTDGFGLSGRLGSLQRTYCCRRSLVTLGEFWNVLAHF